MTCRDDHLTGLEVYRVGGAVRDAYLGWPVYDNDWVVVGATPEIMEQRGFKSVGRDFPVFLHPETHEEYALARTERKKGRGYTGFEVQASADVTLEDDLKRRDLTCNAMAETPEGELVDPYGGLKDLRRGVLRHVSPAFAEDPLRVLRTARFLARYRHLGFAIAEDTQDLMAALVDNGEMQYLVAERIWVETVKALGEPSPDAYFEALNACRALFVLMPELATDQAELEAALLRMQRLPEIEEADDEVIPRWRWARLCEHLDDEARLSLQQRLRVPNAYADLSAQVAATRRLRKASVKGGAEAAKVVDWLNAIDAWRRDERVYPQLRLLRQDTPCLADRIAQGWEAASRIQPRELLDAGYQGKALGEALAARRMAAIENALVNEREQ
ncbi:polynucleotide adenylyltransferase [Aidingimonas halophila]|uniref:tRNA nucleotidyltransferase (CCA-adding enzyme) n=1 Tax=Aidingimonas halophila TaxID=574349 RepID=A0A1H2UFK5_9GAMM|nr:polynucleotide adenylyltransferase [Aidingimonas halophila]GHC22562.1 multifunctional CCA protein [Aidingimonas halophila]SDW54867.1 tRNA nucleotidyltransferase (CCA-adding enzyme) [Aidingimonas halophila]